MRRLDVAHTSGRPTLSLGDRLCVALGLRRECAVVTADAARAELDLPIEVELVR